MGQAAAGQESIMGGKTRKKALSHEHTPEGVQKHYSPEKWTVHQLDTHLTCKETDACDMLMFLGKLCLKHTQDLQQNRRVTDGSFSVNIEHTVPVQ